MKPISKLIAAPAAVFAFALFVMAAPAAYADDYCITNGAQTAHGCGYPSMETCRAASSGMGGTCSPAAVTQSPGNALAYQPKPSHARSEPHAKKPAGH